VLMTPSWERGCYAPIAFYGNPWDYARIRSVATGLHSLQHPQKGARCRLYRECAELPLKMLSAAAEFLFGSLHGLRGGLCPDCAAQLMDCTRHEMVKAIKELILDGSVLAESAACSGCTRVGVVARLRQPRF